MQYLKLRYGYVPTLYLNDIMALDDMIADRKRMDEDISKQTKEFEKTMKKQGKDFNRL